VQGGGALGAALGTGGGPGALVAAALAVVGAGHFGATVAFTALASTGVGRRDQATAAGAVGTAQQLGGALGPLVIAAALGSSGTAYPRALTAAAAVSVAGAVAAVLIADPRAQQPAANPVE
jgi:hypothetical protein